MQLNLTGWSKLVVLMITKKCTLRRVAISDLQVGVYQIRKCNLQVGQKWET